MASKNTITIPSAFNGLAVVTKSTVSGASSEMSIEQLLQPLLVALNAWVANRTRSQSQSLSLAMALMSCSYLIAPMTLARILGNPRTRSAPPKDDAPFILDAAGLAPQALSAALPVTTSEDDGVPRVFVFDTVRLDPGTSFADISINVYVGGELVEELEGIQLDPATANACVSKSMCGRKVCIGMLQDLTIRVRNDSSAALGTGATIRVTGHVAFPGDPEFVDCWAGACSTGGLTAKVDAACSCSTGADPWKLDEPLG